MAGLSAWSLGTSAFIRELTPQNLKLEVVQFTRGEPVKAAQYLAFVVGRAHARQNDAAARAEWSPALTARGHAALDAPSWLWNV